MNKTPKLIKDCKVGDTLYYVILQDGSTKDLIIPVSIEKIEMGDAFGIKPNVYKCKSIYGSDSDTYEFNHTNSEQHDSLIVDTDYAYGKDDDGFKTNYERFYTTYDGAVE